MNAILEFADISDEFEFEEQSLDYVDAPLAGWLKRKAGEWFAFECQPIIQDLLWHWTLVPVADRRNTDASQALRQASQASTGYWEA